eukprot:5978797-Amphidinium_carterae.1
MVELGLRLIFEPMHRLLRPRKRGWLFMDCGLVAMCIMEIILEVLRLKHQGAQLAGRLVRTLRIAKVTRVLKLFRFMTELRVMVTMIISSLSSLFWLLVLLLAMVYIFAIVLTQGVVDFFDDTQNDPSPLDLHYRGVLRRKFGDLPRTMETLFA